MKPYERNKTKQKANKESREEVEEYSNLLRLCESAMKDAWLDSENDYWDSW
jgi:hypothetical protein